MRAQAVAMLGSHGGDGVGDVIVGGGTGEKDGCCECVMETVMEANTHNGSKNERQRNRRYRGESKE